MKQECLVFILSSDKQHFEETIADLEKRYSIKNIINLSKDAKLDYCTKYDSKHIVDYALEIGKEYREKSNQWVLDIGKTKLESGKSLIDFLHRGISVWWFVELGMQERAFHIIRLLETILHLLDESNVNAIALVGNDENNWTKSLVSKITSWKRLEFVYYEHTQKQVASAAKKSIRIIGRVISNREKKLRRFLFMVLGLPVASVFSLIVSTSRTEDEEIHLKKEVVFFLSCLKMFVRSPVELDIFQIGSRIIHLLGIVEPVSSFRRRNLSSLRKINKICGGVPGKILSARFRIRARGAETKRRLNSIVLLCEAGAIKERRSLLNYKKNQYHPYMENLPQALKKYAEKMDLPLLCLYYGSSFLKSVKLLPKESKASISEFFDESYAQIRSQYNERVLEFTEKLKNDKNLRSKLNYN